MGILDDFARRANPETSVEDEKNDVHSIRFRKYAKRRRTIGIIAGASIAIGFYALAPNSLNVDAVGATCVGVGSALVTHGLVKNFQIKKHGIKKHSILKRVLFGSNENRPTLADKVSLALAVAPSAILFIAGGDQLVIPMIAGITAYVGKRLYNAVKDKNKDSEGKTR